MVILCFARFQITTSTAFPISLNFLLMVLFTKSSVLSLSSFGSSLVLPIVVAGNDGLIEIKKGRKKERNLREAEFWLGCRESACMHCGSWPMRRDSLFFSASLCSREATSGHDSQKTPSHVPRFWLCVKWLHISLCPALHCIWSWMVRMEAAIVDSPRMEMSLVYPCDSDRVASPSTLLSEHCRLFQQDKTVYVVPHAYASGQ